MQTTTSNYHRLNARNLNVRNESFHENHWGERHARAWQHPRVGSEYMIKTLLVALAEYADHYHHNDWAQGYETLSMDGYAGPAWMEMIRRARHLLSMDLGGLDGGTLDASIIEMIQAEGFTDSDL